MSNIPEESIRIYFSSDFNKDEVTEITNGFNKIAPTRGLANSQVCCDSIESEIVQTAFMTIIIFVGGGLITGILNSIGDDLKEKLATALKHKKNAYVNFTLVYKGVRIEISAKPESEAEWKNVFDTINVAGKNAIDEIERNQAIRGIFINYDLTIDGYWNLEKF
jgi:hypothetical protein